MNEHVRFLKCKARTYIPIVFIVAIGMIIGVIFDMRGFNAQSIKIYLSFFFTVMLLALLFEWIYFSIWGKAK